MSKPLTGESGKDLKQPTVDTIKMMCAYSHKRDQAVGLRLSRHTRGLVWYGQERVTRDIKNIARAALAKGAMDRIQARMKEIMGAIETSQPDTRKELLAEARMLQKEARRMTNGI